MEIRVAKKGDNLQQYPHVLRKTQTWLVHFQLNVAYLVFNIEGKTEIGFASEDEGPVIGLL